MPWTHRSFWIAPLLIAAILGLLWLVVLKTVLRQIYRKHMAESRRERMFLAAAGSRFDVERVRVPGNAKDYTSRQAIRPAWPTSIA